MQHGSDAVTNARRSTSTSHAPGSRGHAHLGETYLQCWRQGQRRVTQWNRVQDFDRAALLRCPDEDTIHAI